MESNPCTDKLTDIEYLEHMIPHHQVAVDMCNLLLPETCDPQMLDLCRNIKRIQEYEIWEMNNMKKLLLSNDYMRGMFNKNDIQTTMDIYHPKLSKDKSGDCNPLFFKPDDHSKHMEHMKINRKSFLEHMIPHHQVAIDMSKRLLLHTQNLYLIEFCIQLIIEQQGEIYLMNNLLKSNNFIYNSNLLCDI